MSSDKICIARVHKYHEDKLVGYNDCKDSREEGSLFCSAHKYPTSRIYLARTTISEWDYLRKDFDRFND